MTFLYVLHKKLHQQREDNSSIILTSLAKLYNTALSDVDLYTDLFHTNILMIVSETILDWYRIITWLFTSVDLETLFNPVSTYTITVMFTGTVLL